MITLGCCYYCAAFIAYYYYHQCSGSEWLTVLFRIEATHPTLLYLCPGRNVTESDCQVLIISIWKQEIVANNIGGTQSGSGLNFTETRPARKTTVEPLLSTKCTRMFGRSHTGEISYWKTKEPKKFCWNSYCARKYDFCALVDSTDEFDIRPSRSMVSTLAADFLSLALLGAHKWSAKWFHRLCKVG